MTKPKAPPDPIFQKAVEWTIRLEDSNDSKLHADFEAWRSADPRHAAASAQLTGFLNKVQSLRPAQPAQASPAHQAVQTALAIGPRKRRTSVRQKVVLAAVIVMPLCLGLKLWSPAYWLADYQSGTDWRELTLADGTRVSLSQRSAFDFSTSQNRRVLTLLRGEVRIQVAHDAIHPFFVHTEEAEIRSLGTRFIVARDAGQTLVSMLESRTAVTPSMPPKGQTPLYLAAGDQASIDDKGHSALTQIQPQLLDQAWDTHQLIALDQPLASVLATLARHHQGWLTFDAEALKVVHVSAVLPLDDSARAMRLLSASLPGLRVETLSPYWIVVGWQAPSAQAVQQDPL